MADLFHPETQGRHTQHSHHGVRWRGCAHGSHSTPLRRSSEAVVQQIHSIPSATCAASVFFSWTSGAVRWPTASAAPVMVSRRCY